MLCTLHIHLLKLLCCYFHAVELRRKACGVELLKEFCFAGGEEKRKGREGDGRNETTNEGVPFL